MTTYIKQYSLATDTTLALTTQGGTLAKFNQGDVNTNKISLTITHQNAVMDLTGATISVVLQKADGKVVYQDTTNGVTVTDAVNGKLDILLNTQSRAFPGLVTGSVRITFPNSNIIETEKFTYTVESSIASDQAIASANDISSLLGTATLTTHAQDVKGAINEVNANVNSNTSSLAAITAQTVNVLKPPTPYAAAKGDGINDDTTAIQNLLNAFGKVYIPATTQFYKITAPLTLNYGYQIIGDGYASKLRGFGNFNAIFQNVNGITTSASIITTVLIKNVYLVKDSSATIQFGIDTTNISHSVFDYINIVGFSDAGILCNHTSASYNNLSNISCTNNTNDGIRLINNANTNRIYSYTATNNGRNGIRIGDTSFSVETTEILGGSIEGSGQSAIYVGGRGVIISGMHIEGNSLNYAGYGIETPTNNGLYNNVVIGCYFWNNGNDTNHISHVQGITLTNTSQCIQAVFALGTSFMSYIRDSYLNMGANGYVFVGDNTGMYNSNGEVWIETSGSGKNFNIKGYGGFDASLKLNGKTEYKADGTIVNAGKGTYFLSAMPSTGSYTQGDWVRNTTPTIQGTTPNRYIVKGWYRLTTGSTHVLNTDWWEERVSNGS